MVVLCPLNMGKEVTGPQIPAKLPEDAMLAEGRDALLYLQRHQLAMGGRAVQYSDPFFGSYNIQHLITYFLSPIEEMRIKQSNGLLNLNCPGLITLVQIS